jgi:hypothetical protein
MNGHWDDGLRRSSLLVVPSIVIRVLLALLLAAWSATMRASGGYEASGYFTYTSFDPSGNPTYKNVMMFDVKVAASNWWIRVEPVIEGKGGVGFYEASLNTNDSVLMVTALESAYKRSESPFQTLRAELKESKKEDVYFTAPHIGTAPNYSDLFPNRAPFREPPTSAGKAATNSMDNIATAVVLKGKYPPSDPSYTALLMFAFTPPDEQNGAGNKLLIQTWDDGNPRKTRFRMATWKQLPDPPFLASSAMYVWAGKELLPDGTLASISTSDVSEPSEMAARYDMDAVTNFGGFALPLSFKLTRFDTKRPREVVTTVAASVVNVSRLALDEPLGVEFPGKTFVSDYRLSAGELKGSHLGYLLDSNPLPAVERLKQTPRYKHTLAAVAATTPRPYLRWVMLAVFAIPPLVLGIFWRKVTDHKSRAGSSPEQTRNNKT